uniref:Uncharacterized protein n=1 Tax=Phakopsora pachyrhizi TaxID=170000 RepID=A0A0S1MIM1_PHAPC
MSVVLCVQGVLVVGRRVVSRPGNELVVCFFFLRVKTISRGGRAHIALRV